MSLGIPKRGPLAAAMFKRGPLAAAVLAAALLSACGGGGGGSDGASANGNQSGNQGNNGGSTGGVSGSNLGAYSVGPATPLLSLADGRMVLQASISLAGSSGVLPGLLLWDPATQAVQKGVTFTLSGADLVALVGSGATATNTAAYVQGARATPDGGLVLSVDLFGPNQSQTTSAGKAHLYAKLDSSLAIQWVQAYAPFEDFGGIEARSNGYVSSNGLGFDLNGTLTSALSVPSIPYFSQLLGSGNSLLFSGAVIGNANGSYQRYSGESCFGNAAALAADGGAIVAGASGASDNPTLCKTDTNGAPVAAVALNYAAPGGAYGGFNSVVALAGAYYAVSTNSVNDAAVPSYAEWALCKFSASLVLDHCVVSTDHSGIAHSVIGLQANSSTGHVYVSTAGSSPFAVLDGNLNLLAGSSHTVAPLTVVASNRAITASATTAVFPTDQLAQIQALHKVVTPIRLEIAAANMTLPAIFAALMK